MNSQSFTIDTREHQNHFYYFRFSSPIYVAFAYHTYTLGGAVGGVATISRAGAEVGVAPPGGGVAPLAPARVLRSLRFARRAYTPAARQDGLSPYRRRAARRSKRTASRPEGAELALLRRCRLTGMVRPRKMTYVDTSQRCYDVTHYHQYTSESSPI